MPPPTRCSLAVCVVAALASAAAAADAATVTAPLAGGGTVTVSVGSLSSFRLSVRFGGWGDAPLDSPSLDSSRALAPSSPASAHNMIGLRTAFGTLLVATDGSGAWTLQDAAGAELVASAGTPAQVADAAGERGVLLPVKGAGVSDGPTRGASCLNNGDFGTPFFHNSAGSYLAFPASSWLYDPLQPHCYPASFAGAPPLPLTPPSCTAATPDKAPVGGVRTLSYPDGLPGATLSYCCRLCGQDEMCAGFQYRPGGKDGSPSQCWPLASWAALEDAPGDAWYGPAVAPARGGPAWWVLGDGAADWYLAPAQRPTDFTRALYDLSGAPGVPPIYALGLMVTYWGYENMEHVEGNVTAFRDGRYPIDSHIMDYDWWNPRMKYNDSLPLDFGYDPVFFGPHTFVHPPGSSVPNASTTGVVDLLAHFRDALGVRFAGIRKPRTYSNMAFSNASGWLLPNNFSVGAGPENWNMTPGNGWEEWWVARTDHFLRDGIGFWWNDEGETQYYTYTWWNNAQAAVVASATPNMRHWSINRAFQPGMQRWPAITWSGDDQDCSHAKYLEFIRAGQPWFACDMTSPSATVLVRQYQNAVTLPIMRVHAMHGTPRFPFLWGGEEHQAAFRAALDLRYALIPHIYSLAHAAHSRNAPLAQPASWVFPPSPAFPAALGDAIYLLGDALLPADVSVARVADPLENRTSAYLPPGTWFVFNSTAALPGLQRVTDDATPLDRVVLYVRAGALVALNRVGAAGPPQHTRALGGDLDVHVYAGADAAFELVEDDGASLDYAKKGATKTTRFAWTQATRSLAWTVHAAGGVAGLPNAYTRVWPTLFEANATQRYDKGGVEIGAGGKVSW